ncbi:hypothetical protein BDV09DRAFT_175543 [Aspergillus tetrazonus]
MFFNSSRPALISIPRFHLWTAADSLSSILTPPSSRWQPFLLSVPKKTSLRLANPRRQHPLNLNNLHTRSVRSSPRCFLRVQHSPRKISPSKKVGSSSSPAAPQALVSSLPKSSTLEVAPYTSPAGRRRRQRKQSRRSRLLSANATARSTTSSLNSTT